MTRNYISRVSKYSVTYTVTIFIVTVISFVFEYLIYKYRFAGALSQHVRNAFLDIFVLNGSLLLLSLPLYLYLTYKYKLGFKKKLLIIYAEIFLIVIALAYGTFAGGLDFSSIYTYYRIFITFLLGFFFVSLESYFVKRKEIKLS